MKQIEFTTTMAPFNVGDRRGVPDDLADKLVAAGEAKIVPSVFDAVAPAAKAGPLAEALKSGKRYLTRSAQSAKPIVARKD